MITAQEEKDWELKKFGSKCSTPFNDDDDDDYKPCRRRLAADQRTLRRS